MGLGGQGDGAGHGGYMLAAVSYSFQASSIRVYSSKILDFTFTGGVGGGKWNIVRNPAVEKLNKSWSKLARPGHILTLALASLFGSRGQQCWNSL